MHLPAGLPTRSLSKTQSWSTFDPSVHSPALCHQHRCIPSRIATMSFETPSRLPLSEHAASEVLGSVRQLKQERDEWQHMALRYKTAFELQTRQLREFQDICVATQAELENERLLQRPQNTKSNCSDRGDPSHETVRYSVPPSTNTLKKGDLGWVPLQTVSSHPNTVKHIDGEQRHNKAIGEVDYLLQGPLGAEARVEGLMLKSALLQSAGSDSLYDALAQCSEALDNCKHLAELETFLPKIQHQKDSCRHRLSLASYAKAASSVGKDNDLDSDMTLDCTELHGDMECISERRSAFDLRRTSSEDYLLLRKDVVFKHTKRRLAAQNHKLKPSSKPSKLSVPCRWKMSKSI